MYHLTSNGEVSKSGEKTKPRLSFQKRAAKQSPAKANEYDKPASQKMAVRKKRNS